MTQSRLIRRGFQRGGLIALAALASFALFAGSQNSANAAMDGGVGLTVKVVVPANPVTAPRPVIDVPIVIPDNKPIAQVTFVIDLSGLQPFSYVEILARSEPVVIASGFADANGQFNATVDIPDNLPPGDHSITIANTLTDGSFQEITLAQFNVSETGTVGEAENPVVDGVLSLEVPLNAAAQFGTPSLINNRSVTLGTVGAFAVVDNRVVSKPGWTLGVNVAPFVLSGNPAMTFGSSYLGLTPVRESSSTSVQAEVVLGTVLSAGSAYYPSIFAEAAPGVGAGRTALNGTLTLQPPVEHTAGTYTSTMTLTLTSK
jgi:hypothetical protein